MPLPPDTLELKPALPPTLVTGLPARMVHRCLIATACMAAGIPLIVLLLKGFPPFFKPQPRYLEACSAGRLLMLAPYPWQNEKLTDMRARCLRLNDLAAAICQQKQKEEP